MSTIEKLFVQIFERKKRIIDQANQQFCFFDNYLRSKLLIDGIDPPPWLHNLEVHSLPSDPKEVTKEDILLEALIPQSKHSFSGIHHDVYSQFVANSDGGNHSDAVHHAVHGLSNDYEAESVLPIFPECSVNEDGCASTSVPIVDSSFVSPLDRAEAVSDNDPSLSLAKMQRSKSRQRALDIRSSVKLVKTCSKNENDVNLHTGSDEACPDLGVKFNNGGEDQEAEVVLPSEAIDKGCVVKDDGLAHHQSERKNSFSCSERVNRCRNTSQKSNHAVNSLVSNEDGSLSEDSNKYSCFGVESHEKEIIMKDSEVYKQDQPRHSDSEFSKLDFSLNVLQDSDPGITNAVCNSTQSPHIVIQDVCDSEKSNLFVRVPHGTSENERRVTIVGKIQSSILYNQNADFSFDKSFSDSRVACCSNGQQGEKSSIPRSCTNDVDVLSSQQKCREVEGKQANALAISTHLLEDPQDSNRRNLEVSEYFIEGLLENGRQNTDFSFDKSFSDSKAVCCSNGQQSQKSTIPRSCTHDVDILSSQKKRRKFEGQEAKSPAISTGLLEDPQDSNRRNLEVSQYCIDGLPGNEHSPYQQKEGGHVDICTKSTEESTFSEPCDRSTLEFGQGEGKHIPDGKDSHAEALFTFSLNEFEESLVSGLTEQGCRDSESLLLEQIRAVDPVNAVSDAMQQCFTSAGQLPFNLTYDHGMESANHVGCLDGTGKEVASSLSVNASSHAPLSQWMDMGSTSDTMPEFEGFLVQSDSFQPWLDNEKIRIGEVELPKDNPPVLEQVRMSASMHSPVCSSTMLGLHGIHDFYRSVPNGLLEGMGLKSSVPMEGDNPRPHSEGLPNFKICSTWDMITSYRSPVRTLREDITLKYGSSGKRVSSNPELPSINEENEHADELPETFQKGNGSVVIASSVRREPLANIVNIANPTAFVSQDEMFSERCSLESVNTEISFSGAPKRVKQKTEKQNGCSRKRTNKGKENHSTSLGANGANRTTESLKNRFNRPKLSQETGKRKQGPSSGTEPLCSNILSNITSFIPLVQKKQAAAALTGKRDIKVKALETAEAAKRLAEKKENERRMKKDALRVQRERSEQERLVQENMKQLELQKKRKEEEHKRKEANMEAKKRQREGEEERKEGKKRKHLADTLKQQLEHGEKCGAKKDDKEIKCQAMGAKAQGSKDSRDEGDMYKEFDHKQGFGLNENTETTTAPANDEIKESIRIQDSQTSTESGCSPKVNCNMIKQKEDVILCPKTCEEQSYEISPYKESDDEDEDENGDDGTHKKFVPPWASRHYLSLVVSSQKIVNPETIFPPQSFCSISEALLPRQHRLT